MEGSSYGFNEWDFLLDNPCDNLHQRFTCSFWLNLL